MQQTIAQGWVEEGIKIGEERGEKRGIEQGITRSLVNSIIRIGTKRLGEPSSSLRDALAGITDVDRLNVLFDRVQEIAAWNHLFTD